jgi:chromosomal replication initiation ATPase DnaA
MVVLYEPTNNVSLGSVMSLYAIPNLAPQKLLAPNCKSKAEVVRLVIQFVVNHFGVTWESIDNRSRKTECIIPRQIIMYFLSIYFKMSLREIGEIFSAKFDHTTVLNGRERIRSLSQTDYLRYEVQEICRRTKQLKIKN